VRMHMGVREALRNTHADPKPYAENGIQKGDADKFHIDIGHDDSPTQTFADGEE